MKDFHPFDLFRYTLKCNTSLVGSLQLQTSKPEAVILFKVSCFNECDDVCWHVIRAWIKRFCFFGMVVAAACIRYLVHVSPEVDVRFGADKLELLRSWALHSNLFMFLVFWLWLARVVACFLLDVMNIKLGTMHWSHIMRIIFSLIYFDMRRIYSACRWSLPLFLSKLLSICSFYTNLRLFCLAFFAFALFKPNLIIF